MQIGHVVVCWKVPIVLLEFSIASTQSGQTGKPGSTCAPLQRDAQAVRYFSIEVPASYYDYLELKTSKRAAKSKGLFDYELD